MKPAFAPKKTPAVHHSRSPERMHKQERAVLTREKLVSAARIVFARDGFEHASLEEIASLAGKTRGAFYDNFQSKADVFFAIFEEDLQCERDKMRTAIRKSSTLEGRLDLLADYLTSLIKNRERTLLYMEFKTYAIRHPEHRGLLADLHAAMRMRCSLPEIEEMIPALTEQTDREKRELSLAITGILDGLAMNNLFDPGVLNTKHLQRYLRICLDEAIAQVVEEKSSR